MLNNRCNTKDRLLNAQELVEVLHSGNLSHHDAVDVLAVIIAKIKLGETTWEKLGTSYGSCYAHMRLALTRDTRIILKKLREGFFEPEKATEEARIILEKSLISLDEIGTTLEEMIKFIS